MEKTQQQAVSCSHAYMHASKENIKMFRWVENYEEDMNQL